MGLRTFERCQFQKVAQHRQSSCVITYNQKILEILPSKKLNNLFKFLKSHPEIEKSLFTTVVGYVMVHYI